MKPKGPSEKEFQSMVIRLARLRGWLCAAFRPARTARGWRTPVQADGAGWPDLILLRGKEMIAAELKVGRNDLTPRQRMWLDELVEVLGVKTRVWRPEDWNEIEADLL